MKRKLIMHTFTALLSLALLVTISYAWWTGAEASNSLEITTANIASEVKIYEGYDFNRDGNLDQIENPDKQGEFIDSFNSTELKKEQTQTGGKPANIILSLLDIAPTEVFTWKVTIKNMGDAAGYVRAEISSDYDNANDNYLKFFSMRAVWTENGVKKLSQKRYFADLFKNGGTPQGALLFGGREVDKVDVGIISEYYFKIELEDYESLIDVDSQGISHLEDNQANRDAYLALPGKKVKYCFLDIVLSSEKPTPTV